MLQRCSAWIMQLTPQELGSWKWANSQLFHYHTFCSPALSSGAHTARLCHSACVAVAACCRIRIMMDTAALQHCCGPSDTHRPPASRGGTPRLHRLPPARLNNRPSSHRRSSRRQAMGRRALVLHMAHTVHRQAARHSSNPRRSSRRRAMGSRALVLPMVGPQVSVPPMKSFAQTLQVMHARPLTRQMAKLGFCNNPTLQQLSAGCGRGPLIAPLWASCCCAMGAPPSNSM